MTHRITPLITRSRMGPLPVAALVAVVCLWGCLSGCEKQEQAEPVSDPGTGEHVPRTEAGVIKEERALYPSELDTLRVWRERLKLTRDEYWDDYGGVVANEWAGRWRW